MNKNFTKEDIDIINQTVTVPFESFGEEILRYFFSDSFIEVQELYKRIEKKADSKEEYFDLLDIDIVLLLKVFIVSRDICDPLEFETITSYEWNRSTLLILKLIDCISSK